MDLSFFHLKSNPFTSKPTPEQLFWRRSQRDILQPIIYGIEGRKGFMAFLGERGLGKKTLLHAYLDLREQKNVQMIAFSGMGCAFTTILECLCQHCEVSPFDDDMDTTLYRLRAALVRARERGHRVVLLLEEAESIPMETLEHLLVFADMQDEAGKLLQIIFLGGPGFVHNLNQSASQQLKRAIGIRVFLKPLTTKESVAYVQVRIDSVALRPEPVFTRHALRRLVRYARGNPGMLNYLCSEALSTALCYQQKPVSGAIVREVLRDVQGGRGMPLLRWGMAGLAGAGLALGLYIGGAKMVAFWKHSKPAWVTSIALERSRSVEVPQMPRPDMQTAPVAILPATPPEPLPTVTQNALPDATDEKPAPPGLASSDRMPSEPSRHTAASETGATIGNGTEPEQERATRFLASGALMEDAQVAVTSVLCVTARPIGHQGRDIILVDAMGNVVQRLVADGALNLAPALSPDGRTLAYTSYREGEPGIYLRHLDRATDERIILRPGSAIPGSWSPNGRYLLLSKSEDGNSDIFHYDMERRHLRRLTSHPSIDISPSFAPDSSRIVFTSTRSGSSQIYLTDVNRQPPIRLTPEGGFNMSAVWAPQGETIAFIGRSADQSQDLYTIQADATELRRLTTDGSVSEEAPTWAPDGQSIMYTRVHGGVRERRIVRVDGQDNRLLPGHGSVCYSPQWVARHTD